MRTTVIAGCPQGGTHKVMAAAPPAGGNMPIQDGRL